MGGRRVPPMGGSPRFWPAAYNRKAGGNKLPSSISPPAIPFLGVQGARPLAGQPPLG